MKKLVVYGLLLSLGLSLTGCWEEKKAEPPKKLTCKDSREGRTEEEIKDIATDCFMGGHFTKSTPRSW